MITKQQLNSVERFADKLWAKVGLDIEFTKHFLDRVNDARNKKQITTSELIRLFRQSFKKYGKKIASLGKDAQAVIKDMETDINMPFVLQLDKNGELDLVAKTVMRKKDFKTPNQKFAVEDANQPVYKYKKATPSEDSKKKTMKNENTDIEQLDEAKKMTAAAIVKMFKDEDEWGPDMKLQVRNVKGNLEFVDSYWAGSDKALQQLIDSWTKPNGTYAKFFKDDYGTTFKLVDKFTLTKATGRYKKITDNGIVGVVLKVVGGTISEDVEQLDEASNADLKKVLAIAKKIGGSVKGNTVDFGEGSVIDFSIEKGKIKMDGGMSFGVEYFSTAKEAIAALSAGMDESTDLEEATQPFKSLEMAWLRTGGDKKKQARLIKKHELKPIISNVRPGSVKLGVLNKLKAKGNKPHTVAGLDAEGELIFVTNNPTKIYYPVKGKGKRPEGTELKEDLNHLRLRRIVELSIGEQDQTVVDNFIESSSLDISASRTEIKDSFKRFMNLDESYQKSQGWARTNEAIYMLEKALKPTSNLAKGLYKVENVKPEFKSLANHMSAVVSIWEDINYNLEMMESYKPSQGYTSANKAIYMLEKSLTPTSSLARGINKVENMTKEFSDLEKHMSDIVDLWEEIGRALFMNESTELTEDSWVVYDVKTNKVVKRLKTWNAAKKAKAKDPSRLEIEDSAYYHDRMKKSKNEEVEDLEEAVKWWSVTITKKTGKLSKGQNVEVKAANSAQAIKKGLKKMKANPVLVPNDAVDAKLSKKQMTTVESTELEEAKNVTVRSLRQMLFKIDSSAADNFRRELFNVDAQDSPATSAQIKKAKKIIGKDAFVQRESTELEEGTAYVTNGKKTYQFDSTSKALTMYDSLGGTSKGWSVVTDPSKVKGTKIMKESKNDKQKDIESLKKMIKNPDPKRVKQYGGTKYVDMLKKKLAKLEEAEGYEAKKYYAKFGGRVVGPYDTEKDAYHDTKGDAEWIKKGKDIKESAKLEEDDDPCWKGYKQLGMKKKDGKEVPNCVPEETELDEGVKLSSDSTFGFKGATKTNKQDLKKNLNRVLQSIKRTGSFDNDDQISQYLNSRMGRHLADFLTFDVDDKRLDKYLSKNTKMFKKHG